MNNYKNRQRWKLLLFISAIIIGLWSLWYTNRLAEKLAAGERRTMELMAEAYRYIVNAEMNDPNLEFYTLIISGNENVPVIVMDSLNNIILERNLDPVKMKNPVYSERKISQLMSGSDPLIISLGQDEKQYLYYGTSLLLVKLSYYPYIQLFIIILFISVAYFAFNSSVKAEQNQLWAGLSKETAHQLGTPISSLMALFEVLKLRLGNDLILTEFEKDIKRLEKITERFSKIGSMPLLLNENLSPVVQSVIHYLQPRLSDKVKFRLNIPQNEVIVPLNPALFEWVIENLCKNAADALNGIGEITVSIEEYTQYVTIDIADTGKGIPKNQLKAIFRPGFTTKKTGWGLGLSLVRRIVETYHDGRVFVLNSELNKGTVFRILLKKHTVKN